MLFLIRFKTNYFGRSLGFQFKYETTDESQWSYNSGGCGGNFIKSNGILTSPSYPDRYPENADCVYIISQPYGTYIDLRIQYIDIEGSGRQGFCDYDYLEIRDGNSGYSELLAKLCGNDVPAPMQSTQNFVWMRLEPRHFCTILIATYFALLNLQI